MSEGSQRRFAIFVRLNQDYRDQVDKLGDILIAAPVGGKVPLAQLASFKLSTGDSLVTRENSLRRTVVMCNVKGRDIGSFVRDAQQAVALQVKTPAGTFNTIRVGPEGDYGPLKNHGRIWIWYTDDAQHLPVQMRARLFWGTLTVYLTGVDGK